MKVLVTGATGFIGRHTVSELLARDTKVRVLVRAKSREIAEKIWAGSVEITCGNITDIETLRAACSGCEIIIHLAGYAHAEDASEPAAFAEHQHVTIDGTRILLGMARSTGVRRFVFVSSVKAMGEEGSQCLDESSPVNPVTMYGQAKCAAENLVHATGNEGMETCILRLPLVYGVSSKGNLARMIEAVDTGRFPPLPEIGNRRSMVHVHDVVQALILAVEKNEAVGKIYFVTDGEIYSIRRIYVAICGALGKKAPRSSAWTDRETG